MSGYRGFTSRSEYEAHYSDPEKYKHEIPAMEAYAREAEQERSIEMRRRRIIIEVDLAPNTDINEWHEGLVPLMRNTLHNVVYIATEDAKEPNVISGYRKK